ncbi:MAG: radical SAM protein [Deltaproteobacteria bacterium]|nr:radical SAM protein [Deltaproteobacteria bacterium]
MVNVKFVAAYRSAFERGVLRERVEAIEAMLASCELCPRACRADRARGETGFCEADGGLSVSSTFAHFGEEAPLVGRNGSGTIFFSRCNLCCVFCQNHDISDLGEGTHVAPEDLAVMMLALERRGCHNINLVTPTHQVPGIARALLFAAAEGLSVPLVFNCGGYESLSVLRLLDGLVDIYMPDVKFMDPEPARLYLDAPDYPGVVREVVKEMHRQVGDLAIGPEGVARRGMLVRHLVMPGLEEDTRRILDFVKDGVSADTFVNIMSQYRPCHRAFEHPAIARRPTREEHLSALAYASVIGLRRAGPH